MSQTGFRTGFVDVLAAAGESLGPTSLSGGGQTGVDAILGGFLKGVAGIRRQRQQSELMAQNAEVARARGEFTQSQTLLNLAKVGEQGAIGRGLLSAFFKGNIPAPIEAAFKEQQGVELSVIEQNESIIQPFITPLADREMLGDTPQENLRSVQHMRGIMRSLKPHQAVTFGRLFHESTVAGRTVFGMTELSPFIESAIENRQDDLGRQEREFRRQVSQANRRSAGSIMRPSTKSRFPDLALRPLVGISDAELQGMAGSIDSRTLDALRSGRDAARREVTALLREEKIASTQRMTIRQPDWPPTVQEFDNTYHADDLAEGVAATLLREVKTKGSIPLNNIEAIIGEMQNMANDRFWDDLGEEHAMAVIELDPTLAHLVADQPLAALEVPGVGLLLPDQLDQIAKDMGKTPAQVRQMFIDRGAVPSP